MAMQRKEETEARIRPRNVSNELKGDRPAPSYHNTNDLY